MHPIKRYRLARGWTQTDLAKELGANMHTVQTWEAGADPRPKYRLKLAEVLGVDPLQLVNEIETWNKEEKPKA